MSEIIQEAEAFVTDKLKNDLPEAVLYHNIQHTQRVVKRVKQLAKEEKVSKEEQEALLLAAWFHDLGFVQTSDGHEEASAELAQDFLTDKDITNEEIGLVQDLILSTKMGNPPQNQLQKIMKDADCSHIASEEFMEISNLLRKERSSLQGQKISKTDWRWGNLNFFNEHQFYTESAKQLWGKQKEANQQQLIAEIEEKSIKKASKPRKLGRGVETLFRVQLKNHIELSAIADTKANILLSVNAIIISVALSGLFPKLDSISNSFLVIPTLVLMLFSVACIVLSVLSTRPNISQKLVTREMIEKKKTNILFFGNFHKMSIDDFEWGIEHLMDNEEILYNSLTKDLYYLGLVLERKYRLLRITYNVFMVGIIISALAFVISYFLTAQVA